MGCAQSGPAQRRFDPATINDGLEKIPVEAKSTISQNIPQTEEETLETKIPSDQSISARTSVTGKTNSSRVLGVEPESLTPANQGGSNKSIKVGFENVSARDVQDRPTGLHEDQPAMKRVAIVDREKDAIIPKLASIDGASTLGENRRLEDFYDVDRTKRIGKGHYASVFVAKSLTSGERVAVKMIEKRLSKTERLALEVNVMRKAGSHPHIVQLIDVFETESQLQLVLELVEGGELFEHLVEHGPYSEATAAHHIRDVTKAMAFLHAQNIIHRDLKPENILLTSKDDSARIKIADFGLAKLMFADVTRTVCGTWAYCAYEVKKPNGAYDNKCDVWSIGVIAFILLSAYHPFDPQGDATDDEIWQRISIADYNFDDGAWDNVSDQAKDFVSRLLVLDPKKRMSAEEALQHPWLKNVPESVADAETQPALSPMINNKLANFHERSKAAKNPLQKAALAMKQRVGSWKSSSTNSNSSPSWAKRNFTIAAAAAAAAARATVRGAGGESGSEGSSQRSRPWSMGGSGRIVVNQQQDAASSATSMTDRNGSSVSPVSSARNQMYGGSEEKSETPPSYSSPTLVATMNYEPYTSSPLRTGPAFVSQATGDTMLVPGTPSTMGALIEEHGEQVMEQTFNEHGISINDRVIMEEEEQPNSPTTGEAVYQTQEYEPTLPSMEVSVAALRVTDTSATADTMRTSDLGTVSEDNDEEHQDGMTDEEDFEESMLTTSEGGQGADHGAESFKTARDQSNNASGLENLDE